MSGKEYGPDQPTWRELCQSIAAKHGKMINDEQADYILWELTAFPLVGVERVVEQIHAAFSATDDQFTVTS